MSIKGKKVLITGGAGFIGANFVYKFLELGHNVFVFEKKGTNLWRVEKVRNKIKIYFPDLTSHKETEKIILKIKPEIILHFAAYGAYQRFQQEVDLTIDTNLEGTINLVNACRKAKVKCFVNTGTASEYGIKQKPMKETDMLEPDNLYGITKAAATMYCQMMARKSGLPVVTVRLFSVYGYFEEPGRLIPDIIKSCLVNSKLKLSKPDSVRDFIFIEDLIEGYLAAIKNIKKIKGGIFNLGSGKQYKIDEVVKIVKKITDSKTKPVYGKIKIAQTEPKKWVADASKAKKMLKWKPKHNLESGLRKTAEWFEKNIRHYD